MKVILLGDIHIGVRNDSPTFAAAARNFFNNFLFPYMKEHGIHTILQTGDIFDRRKYSNHATLMDACNYLFDKLVEHKFTMHVILGNHDIYYKNTLEVNSPEKLLGGYIRGEEGTSHHALKPIILHKEPTKLSFDGWEDGTFTMDMIPWICDSNREDVMKFIKASQSDFCFGHFELSGFEMDKGNVCYTGMDAKVLGKYEQVISGHFHHKSQKGNILYLGAPMEYTWNDYNDEKGFWVLDTETLDFEFHENPEKIFHKITYNDDELSFDDVQNYDFSKYTDKYVKVIVEKKSNTFLFEAFNDHLNKVNPRDVSIVEDFSEIIFTEEDAVNQADDTMSIIDKVVDNLEIDLTKDRLKSILREVYAEALAVE